MLKIIFFCHGFDLADQGLAANKSVHIMTVHNLIFDQSSIYSELQQRNFLIVLCFLVVLTASMTWVGLNDDATEEELVLDDSKKNEIWVSARDRGYVIVIPWVVHMYVEIIHEL